MFLAKNLKELRKERGMSVDTIIEMLHQRDLIYTRASYYKWESGVIEPCLKTIDALCDIFQTNVSYLLSGSGDFGFVLNDIEKFLLTRFRNDQSFRDLSLSLIYFRLKNDKLTSKQKNGMIETLNKMMIKYKLK